MHIRVAGQSVQGVGREKNDDHYCIGSFVEQGALTVLEIDVSSATFREYGLLIAVADGMGGYAGGGLASRIALETLSAQFYGERRNGCSEEDLLGSLQHYLELTQQALLNILQRSPEFKEAGTTLAGIALAPPDLAIVFHLGDSRVLRYSAGYVRPLTVDHTPIGTDIASGWLREEEATYISGGTALLRFLGAQGNAEAEWSVEHSAVPGNSFFLGTDGWSGTGRGLERREIQEIARREGSAEAMTREMILAAVQAGSTDDITVIVVQLVEDEGADG